MGNILSHRFQAFDARLVGSTTLGDLVRFKTFGVGEIILSEASKDDSVYFILEGRVKITNFSAKGDEVWHNELIAGQTFGEMAAITGLPRVATVIAVVPTQIACMTKEEFFILLRQDTEIAIWIMEELAGRLNMASQKLYEHVSYNISQRVRAELVKMCEGLPKTEIGIIISPPPNFSKLAKRMNTDRENVSREISQLKKKGVLEKTKTSLTILNLDYLIETTVL